MRTGWVRFVANLLIVSMCALPYATQAALVGTGDLVATASAQASRDTVQNFVSRADVQNQLQTFGLSADTAKQRVAAMTDDEVRTLAGRIDSLPAGATSNWGWAAVIVIAIVVYMAWK